MLRVTLQMRIIFFVLIIGVYGEKARFDDYELFRIFPANDTQLEALRKLEMEGEYDFWTRVGKVNRKIDVLVSPQKKPTFEELLDVYNISYNIQIENIQRSIDDAELYANTRCIDMDWDSYHKLDEIYDWMNEVAKKHSSVKKVIVGKSSEGRRIQAMEVSFKENTTGVFIESGMHGREWITPAATTWMMKQILESSDDSVFRNFTFYYIPVFNPDSYSYSWTHNRLWKKTRTPYKVGNVICYGADPNRNWDYRWKEFGESENPCSEAYPGPFPFSEVEMRAIASYLKGLAHSRNLDIYVAYRSYSQLLHYPWDSEDSPAPHEEIWKNITEAAVEDLKEVYDTNYDFGTFSKFYEPTGGISSEWFYGNYNATIAFTYEVRDTGDYGFLLPPDQIKPVGEELLVSLERILLEYQQLNFTDETS